MHNSHRPDIGFIPTEPDAIAAMFELADVTSSDVVYDLGCGDGRIVIQAACQFGCRGVGIDIDPVRIQDAQSGAIAAGVDQLVQFRQEDLFTSNFSEATVVTLYLLPHLNLRLLPQLRTQLKLGARILSHDFDLGDWPPDRVVSLTTPEEPTLYCWFLDGS
jgi:SAM-dependent methyltransferase